MGTQVALVFGSVRYPTWDFLAPLRGQATVICADGGLSCAAEAGFEPDVYVGDNDSGGAPPPHVHSVLLQPEKNLTDLQAAYEYARARGFVRIVLTACTGGRQDHHLANLQLLETAADDGIEMCIMDPSNEIWYLNSAERTLDCRNFRYFSMIPLDREVRGVQITNAKYPLHVQTLRRGDSLTVSNEPIHGTAVVHVEHGAVWIVLSERIK